MIKPSSLRAAVTTAAPELKTDPDKLLVFVDQGNVVATGARSLSFEYRYTLNLILTDFAGDSDAVMIALLAWVKLNQPELVDNDELRKHGISFEVDHLNNSTCDLSIKLALTEAVKVTQDGASNYQAKHAQEPVPEWTGNSLAPANG